MRSRSVVVAAALVVTLASSAASAADIKVKPGRRGMERALAKAKPGDTIVLRRVVRADVDVTVPGITIDGQGRGRMTGAVAVRASGVTLRGTRIKRTAVYVNGDDFSLVGNTMEVSSITVYGRRTTLQGNTFDVQGQLDDVAAVFGDGTHAEDNALTTFRSGFRFAGRDVVIRGNAFEGGWRNFAVIGDDALIEDNAAASSGWLAVVGHRTTLRGNRIDGSSEIHGQEAVVQDNELHGGSGSPAIAIVGRRALVSGNVLAGDWGSARVHGDEAVIRDNVVSMERYGSSGALVTVGDGGLIQDNTLTLKRYGGGGGHKAPAPDAIRYEIEQAANDGITVFGGATRVVGNDVSGHFDLGVGVRVQGDGNAVDGNHVHDASRVFAVVLMGTGNTASTNTVADIDGEGVVVQGDGGTVTDTNVRDVSSCGFLLVGSTRLERCLATECNMGIVNLAAGSALVRTVVSGNAPYDLVDLGGAELHGDSFFGGVTNDALAFPAFVPVQGVGFVPAKVPNPHGPLTLANW